LLRTREKGSASPILSQTAIHQAGANALSEASNRDQCACGVAPTLIFACSGAADVGKIADLAARELTAAGVGKMFCLAGIGGRISGIMATTQAAAAILAIDGCPLDCTKKTLETAGFRNFAHLQLSALDMEKGKSPATDERVSEVVRRAELLLGS
jgi:uncharacterized metal-binding protein